jgi:hypothetical protein
MGDDIDMVREAQRAGMIGLQTQDLVKGHGDDRGAIGRAVIRLVKDAAIADRICDTEGHRYHVLKPREPQLYCRRCGTVISADGIGRQAW